MMKKCLLFLAEGFEETEAVGAIDVLRRGCLDVSIVSITHSLEVKGAHGITIKADVLFEDVDFEEADALILPGGMPGANNLNSHLELRARVVDFYSKGKIIAAICAAPIVFGDLGILKNKEAVCYPGFESRLEGAIVSDKKTVIADNVITSIGVISVIDFGLTLVRKLQGDKIADQTASQLLLL